MPRTTICLFIIVCMLMFFQTSGAQENYCLDEQSWEEWDHLVAKYPNDMDIQTLHALRIGLCSKVKRGDITIQKATEIFESFRDSIINKKKSTIIKEGEHL